MKIEEKSFKLLFRKYRLKAEYSTLAQFGDALAEKGYIFEESIFSHWQKGTRLPRNRVVMLKILEIFIERRAITTLDQANLFINSVGLGYLSDNEIQSFSVNLIRPIFQVPPEISNFSNREKIINDILTMKDPYGCKIFIYGPSGVGKTALAIRLAHLLRHHFSDGVLWYKVEDDNIMDILLSIAKVCGEDINSIKDKQVRATVVRSLLSSKNLLIVFDNILNVSDLKILLPNSPFTTVIITSQQGFLRSDLNIIPIHLQPFSISESETFFKNVLQKDYPENKKDFIHKISNRVGNLPLALSIIASQLQEKKEYIHELPSLLTKENSFFNDLYNNNKNLYGAISLSYNNLTLKQKSILASASIFKGKDFSIKSIAYINGLSLPDASYSLQQLINVCLIENSTKNRYRMHPKIIEYVREKLDYPPTSLLIIIAIILLLFFISWWIYLVFFTNQQYEKLLTFSMTYCVMAFYGGFCGLHVSQKWGGVKSFVGRSICMFSIGLFFQLFGQLTYGYYNSVEGIKVPYPSIGDIGYFGTIIFYTYGIYLLARSSGIKINPQLFLKNVSILIIPSIAILFGYFLFLNNYILDSNNLVKVFLDFAYPLGNAIYISLAVITFVFSRKALDGLLKSKALIVLLALVIQYIADYTFLYTSDSYYPGSFVEIIYLISYFVMTVSLINFKSIRVSIKM